MITCKYSCALCGLHRIAVDVPERTIEDIVYWVTEICGRALGDDHAKRSPHCNPSTLTEVMIPITGSDKIGGPAIN